MKNWKTCAGSLRSLSALVAPNGVASPSWKRPELVLENHNCCPRLLHWTALEQVSFWHRESAAAQEDDHGWLCLEYLSGGHASTRQTALFDDHLWRIAARDRHWFTLEFAGFNDLASLWESAPEPLIPSGPAALPDCSEADFWKANAQLYLIESLPFGMVTVQVPRNVRDPEAYALRLARAYLRDQIALEEIHEPQLQWMTRRPPGTKKSEPMPGWGSTVTFHTAPTAS